MEHNHEHNQVTLNVRILALIAGFLFMLSLRPLISDQITNRGMIFYNAGKYRMALWYFKKARLLDTSSPTANLFMAACYEETGNHNKAVYAYKRYIKINPSDARPYYYLGYLYSRRGDYQKALRWFKQAVKIDPKYWQAYLWISTCYKKLGQKERALENLQEMKKIFPKNKRVIENFIKNMEEK